MKLKGSFLCRIQEQNRIAIPKLVMQYDDLKPGDVIIVRIEKRQ